MRLTRRWLAGTSPALFVAIAGTLLAFGLRDTPPTLAQGGPITVYSGRGEALVGQLYQQFTRDTGIEVRARYGDSAQLAAALLEEGRNSPADVFFSHDAGALGAVAAQGMLATLPNQSLGQVPSKFRAWDGSWVGVSGRARVIVYNTNMLSASDLPDTVWGLTDPRWQGKIGWVPTNASLQAAVTAMRVLEGEAAARQWLEGIKANNPRVFSGNAPIVEAVISGELQVGLVNQYYLYGIIKDRGPVTAANYHPRGGGSGAIVNVAGVGILNTARNASAAQQLVDYLLSPAAQQYFADETFEYPLIEGATAHPDLLPIGQINHPDVDLSNLADLEGTLRLMRDLGIL